MSSKKSSGKKSSKPVAARAAASTSAPKERKPRKPPLERAARLGGLLARAFASLKKNVLGWKGDATPEQRLSITKINGELRKLDGETGIVNTITSNLAFLDQSKYQPRVERAAGRPKAFVEGAPVALKDKRYDKTIHGVVNAFIIVGTTDKYFLIKPIGAPASATPLGVPRAWLAKREAPAAAPVATKPTRPAPAARPAAPAPAPDDDDPSDVDEDPGLAEP